MTDKPLGGRDVPEAIQKAVRLATADHHDLAEAVASSWHTVGIIMTDEAKAGAVAKAIVGHAKVDASPTVVRIDPKHLIVGYVSPELIPR